MSTRAHFLRYALLIRRLEYKKRATLAELRDYIREELRDDVKTFSRSSFERDRVAIADLFGITIAVEGTRHEYVIAEDLRNAANYQLLEAWETQHFLGEAAALKPFVQLDGRRGAAGTEHLRPLLRAIRARREVLFRHHKHWDDAPTERRTWPLGLKEWAGRWYLLALDQTRGGELRTFGLDRLRELTETGATFEAQEFDAAEYFRDCYGVTRPADEEPVELVLAFTWAQGRYVEDQPLHHSQTTLRRSFPDDEIRVRLRVYWTHEVKMALLAYGAEVEVLEPAEARAEVAAAHQVEYTD